ncbi:MAG TPA: hypothetical protein VGQ29_09200 [Gemmatimonadales bacterium]|nr:hypothetical protein [Gemmatimonadales bacterium]
MLDTFEPDLNPAHAVAHQTSIRQQERPFLLSFDSKLLEEITGDPRVRGSGIDQRE